MYILIILTGTTVIKGLWFNTCLCTLMTPQHPEKMLTHGSLKGSAVLQPLLNDIRHWQNNYSIPPPCCWCCRLLFHSVVLNVSQPGRLPPPTPAALPVLWNITLSSLTQFPKRASGVFVCADGQRSSRYNALPLFMDWQLWYWCFARTESFQIGS